MDISNRIPGADLTSLQATRPPQGIPRGEDALAAQVAGEDGAVQVTISDAGRAVEAATRTEDVPSVTTQAQPTPPIEGAAEPVRAEGPASATATPGPASRPIAPEPEAVAQSGSRAEPEAGAPTAANAAIELYRENQQRPDDRPPVAPIRASA